MRVPRGLAIAHYSGPAGPHPCYRDRIEIRAGAKVAMRLSNEGILVILFVGLIAGKVVR
ncbi:MAG TPA: hypothetical protein VLN59_08860 [Burkholderiales bacterium]|nr:hypothetical protein [Burkholderiales bacterium]